MIQNFEIRKFNPYDLKVFTEMLSRYFTSDLRIELSQTEFVKLGEKISTLVLEGVLDLDLLVIDGKEVGFINYQVDSKKSDWCERQGWGFIREIYVSNDYRGRSFGGELVNHAEEKLRSRGIKNVYLTSDEADKWWIRSGYESSGEVSIKNKCPIYQKNL